MIMTVKEEAKKSVRRESCQGSALPADRRDVDLEIKLKLFWLASDRSLSHLNQLNDG